MSNCTTMESVKKVTISDGTADFCSHLGEALATHEFFQLIGIANDGEQAIRMITLVTATLHEIGVPAHVKGYQYLREAIIIAVNDMDVLNAVTKVLYPLVAQTFQTTPRRVVRAMQHAICVVWEKGNSNILYKHFGYSSKRPAPSEFIASIADYVQLKMRKG